MTSSPRHRLGRNTDGVLSLLPPPGHLAPWVFGFVQRDDTHGGRVVVVLPETRASIQVMVGDDYWLREQSINTWRTVPRAGLWGPRYNWAYGFAARKIKVFAIGLTPDGAKALTGLRATNLLNAVLPAERVSPIDFSVVAGDSYETWRVRITGTLRRHFRGVGRDNIAWDDALHVLATSAGGAIRDGLPAATDQFPGMLNGRPVTIRVVAIEWSPTEAFRFQMAMPQGTGSATVEGLKRTTYSFRRLSQGERARSVRTPFSW